MKNLMCLVFCVMPFWAFGQDVDSLRVAGEVDSLLEECGKLLDDNKFEDALHLIESTKNKAEIAFGKESMRYADCVYKKGMIFNYYMNKYIEAEPFYLEAKDIYERVLGKEHLKYARILNSFGGLYHVKGEIQKALPLYIEAQTILGKLQGKEHPNYASVINNLAIIYQSEGKYEEALPLFLEAKTIREKVLGKDDPEYALTLAGLAMLYMDMGELDNAASLSIEAKVIREKVFGKEHPDYAFSPFNLGIVYQLKGEYDKALPLYLEAKAIWGRVWGKEDPYYANCLNSLALLYVDMGEYDKALLLNLEVKDIRGKVLGKEHLDYTGCLINLAMGYQLKGEYDKALPLYLESKDIFENVLGKTHPIYATLLNNMAEFYLNKGEFDKSEILALEAKDIREKMLGKTHPDYARSLLALAIAFKAKGEQNRALSLLLEAKEILGKALGKEHPDYAMSIYNMALVYSDQGDNINASSYFISSNTAMKSLIQKSADYSTEREMMHYQVKFDEGFKNLLHFTQSHPTDSLCYAAYDNALFLNNALLFNAVAREKGIAQADSSTRAIHAEWKSCHFQLGKLYSQPIADRNAGLVARLEEQANDYEKELVRRSPEFAEAQKEVYWQDVKSQLNPNEAAIEFINYSWQDRKTKADTTMYAALVLTPNSPAPAFIPLCQEADLLAILDQPQGYRQGYFDRLYRGIKPKAGTKTEGLYQLLWQPLDSLLQGTKRIYYAPSGLLHRINLAAIPNPAEQKNIGATYELVQLGSTRQLVVKNETAFAKKDAVVLGGINYEAESTAPQPPVDSSGTEDALAFGSSLDFNGLTRSLRGGEWKYLEGTEKEATDIAKLLKKKGFQTQKLGGHAATEEAFKSIGQGGPSPRVLHIATHGFFFPDPKTVDGGRWTADGGQAIFKQSDNPMIRSGLILAGANPVWKGEPTPAGKEDGILTAYEISQMNLSNTELVVLSACETGLGDIQGNEGVYGLQRAFKIAGAKHLIMSLWDVPDEETAEFMALFYKEWLGGKDIHVAFRHTQQVMREAYPNEPFFWAGFVLVE